MPTADISSHPGVDFLRAICFSSSIDISVLFIRVLRFHVIAAQQLVATVSLRKRGRRTASLHQGFRSSVVTTTPRSECPSRCNFARARCSISPRCFTKMRPFCSYVLCSEGQSPLPGTFRFCLRTPQRNGRNRRQQQPWEWSSDGVN